MKTVLSLSGGLDSTVLLYHLKYKMGHEVLCLSVNYGQRHKRELQAAERIAFLNGCQWKLADLTAIKDLFAGSSQTSTGIAVPEGHYAEESMKQTVVPNRNMVLLSLATAWAVSAKADFVAYAAHAGDHAIYPDCRPAFAEAMGDAISLCDWHKVKLIRPFLYPTPMDKTTVALMGKELRVPFAETWSCYKGELFHCGKCGTCHERREAFQLAGIDDPTIYQGR